MAEGSEMIPVVKHPTNPEQFAQPELPNLAGIYVVHFEDGTQYIGEGNNLYGRWRFYRNAITPEEMERRKANGQIRFQTTNIRMKALILSELEAGRAVHIETLFSIELDGQPLDMEDKHQRQTAEGIVLTRRKRDGVVVLNA